MRSVDVRKARAELGRLIEEVSVSGRPVRITGGRVEAVLVGGEEWRSVVETMYLLSVPGMRESIRRARREPLKRAVTRGRLVW